METSTYINRLRARIAPGARPGWISVLIALLLQVAGLLLIYASWTEPPRLAAAVAALAVALIVESAAVRSEEGEYFSLVGIVLLAAGLALDGSTAGLVAFLSGLGAAVPRRLARWARIVRRGAESGLRALALLAAIAAWEYVRLIADPTLAGLVLCLAFFAMVWVGRWVLSLVALGSFGSSSRTIFQRWGLFAIELLPLPLGFLLAAIVETLAWPYTLMTIASLITSAVLLRTGSRSLRLQQQRVAELGLLNEVSRAIIRSELDVDALCELVYNEASKVVDTSWFHLGLFEGDRFTLKVRVQNRERLPELTVQLAGEQGIIGWMRRTGRSLLVEDFENEMANLPARPSYQAEHPPRSGIYIPLLAGDEVLGTISIQSPEPYSFSFEDARLLSLVADQAAIAIAKARAYDAARRRAQQLATISEVSRQVTAILDLDQLLPAVVHRIRSSFGYYQVHLFLIDYEAGEVIFRASTNPQSKFWLERNLRLKIGEGIVGYVAQTGDPLLVNDVSEEPRFILDQEQTRAEMALPLRVGKDLIGVLDVQSDRVGAFDANDFFVLQTLADQIAIAIDSANLYTAQQEEAWVLNALLQSAENFGRASDLGQLLRMTVRLPPLLMGADRALCFLWDREARAFQLAASWGLDHKQQARLLAQPVAETDAPLLGEVWRTGHLKEVLQAAAHPSLFPALIPACSEGSLLALPLTARGAVLGVLLLEDCNAARQFSQRQITIASGIAGQAASAIEAAQLSAAEAERQRLEQELNVAREMQTSLLPPCCPDLPGWQLSAAWRSARQVGGDFYDFWTINEHALGFVIADVSDKGVPAALFMTLSRSLIRAAALDGSSPARALERANRWIARDSQAGMFVTAFYGLLDPMSGTLRFSNGGHNPPLLYRAATGEVQTLRTRGIALGVIEENDLFAEAEVVMEPGDLLVCYTDGVTEMIDLAEEQFGEERLIDLIRRHAPESANQIVAAILDETSRYAGGQPPFDDLTLVIVKREVEQWVKAEDLLAFADAIRL